MLGCHRRRRAGDWLAVQAELALILAGIVGRRSALLTVWRWGLVGSHGVVGDSASPED
jgi:hypothetical protein